MVGRIHNCKVPYYDRIRKQESIKARPVLIIANPRENDQEYIVLPISSVSNMRYADEKYDIEINIAEYDKLKLRQNCYVRTHKRTTARLISIDTRNCLGDLKTDYPELFNNIMDKMQQYDQEIMMSF